MTKCVRLFEWGMVWLPLPGLALWFALIVHPATTEAVIAAVSVEHEYNWIEMGTANAFLLSSFLGFWLALRLRRAGARMPAAYFLLYGLVAFLMTLEEVQWFQPVLGFDVPEAIMEVNRQGEFTLHNIGALQSNAHYFYLTFLVGALVLGLPRPGLGGRADIGAEASLIPAVIAVALSTVVKVWSKFGEVPYISLGNVRWTTEITELFIGLWALGYVLFKLVPPNVAPVILAQGGTARNADLHQQAR